MQTEDALSLRWKFRHKDAHLRLSESILAAIDLLRRHPQSFGMQQESIERLFRRLLQYQISPTKAMMINIELARVMLQRGSTADALDLLISLTDVPMPPPPPPSTTATQSSVQNNTSERREHIANANYQRHAMLALLYCAQWVDCMSQRSALAPPGGAMNRGGRLSSKKLKTTTTTRTEHHGGTDAESLGQHTPLWSPYDHDSKLWTRRGRRARSLYNDCQKHLAHAMEYLPYDRWSRLLAMQLHLADGDTKGARNCVWLDEFGGDDGDARRSTKAAVLRDADVLAARLALLLLDDPGFSSSIAAGDDDDVTMRTKATMTMTTMKKRSRAMASPDATAQKAAATAQRAAATAGVESDSRTIRLDTMVCVDACCNLLQVDPHCASAVHALLSLVDEAQTPPHGDYCNGMYDVVWHPSILQGLCYYLDSIVPWTQSSVSTSLEMRVWKGVAQHIHAVGDHVVQLEKKAAHSTQHAQHEAFLQAYQAWCAVQSTLCAHAWWLQSDGHFGVFSTAIHSPHAIETLLQNHNIDMPIAEWMETVLPVYQAQHTAVNMQCALHARQNAFSISDLLGQSATTTGVFLVDSAVQNRVLSALNAYYLQRDEPRLAMQQRMHAIEQSLQTIRSASVICQKKEESMTQQASHPAGTSAPSTVPLGSVSILYGPVHPLPASWWKVFPQMRRKNNQRGMQC